MRVDEAGADDLAGDVDLRFALIAAHTDDLALGDGDVALAQLVGKDIDIRGVLQNQVRPFPSGGDVHEVLLLHQLALNPSGVSFILYCHRHIILSKFHIRRRIASGWYCTHLTIKALICPNGKVYKFPGRFLTQTLPRPARRGIITAKTVIIPAYRHFPPRLRREPENMAALYHFACASWV